MSNRDNRKRTLINSSHVQCQNNGKDRTFSMTSRKATDLTSPGRLRLREITAAGERDNMRRRCLQCARGKGMSKIPCLQCVAVLKKGLPEIPLRSSITSPYVLFRSAHSSPDYPVGASFVIV